MESLQAVMSQPPPFIGQSADLEELFREHHAGVLRAAYRITGNTSDAEDVLQTVFMRLVRRPAAMENVAAYLHRSAVNAALDLVRDRHENKQVALETHEPASTAVAADKQQEAREMRDFIRGAIARLAPRTAEVFALHYFEGYSNPQIAEMLDVSPGGVAVTLHRARTQLKEEISSFLGEAL